MSCFPRLGKRHSGVLLCFENTFHQCIRLLSFQTVKYSVLVHTPRDLSSPDDKIQVVNLPSDSLLQVFSFLVAAIAFSAVLDFPEATMEIEFYIY